MEWFVSFSFSVLHSDLYAIFAREGGVDFIYMGFPDEANNILFIAKPHME